MKADEIKIGGYYIAKVSNNLTVVRVQDRPYGSKSGYLCINMKTGREVVFKSAAKFRKEVTKEQADRIGSF
jgi:hypothetical protein